jgi:phosphoglycolate phosphatase
MTAKKNNLPQAILFDWDNTLVESWPVIHEALNATFAAFNLPLWSLEESKVRVRKSMRDSFPEIFGERWEEAGQVFYEHFAAVHLAKVTPALGARDMLEAISGKGIYLGVISNKKGDYLRLEAAHLGWDAYFGRLVGALDADKDKPAIESVDLALSGSGITKGSHVWLVGDADIDLECAINAQCVPVLLRKEPPNNEEFADHPPVLYFESCPALSKYAQSL